MELTAGALQRRNTSSRPWNIGVADGGLERKSSTLVSRSAGSELALSTLVEVAVRMTALNFMHTGRG